MPIDAATRTITQYWHDGSPPPAIEERMREWQRIHGEWRYRCVDRRMACHFLREAYGEWLQEAFLDIRLPAMQADVFRVAYIYRNGGLWVDAATTCLGPLDAWLDTRVPLLLLRKAHMQPPAVWNGLIYASRPHHPVLGALWGTIAETLANRAGRGVWQAFGPGLYRDTLQDESLQRQVQVIALSSIADFVLAGSSRATMPRGQHWSVRQKSESLYFSRPH